MSANGDCMKLSYRDEWPTTIIVSSLAETVLKEPHQIAKVKSHLAKTQAKITKFIKTSPCPNYSEVSKQLDLLYCTMNSKWNNGHQCMHSTITLAFSTRESVRICPHGLLFGNLLFALLECPREPYTVSERWEWYCNILLSFQNILSNSFIIYRW